MKGKLPVSQMLKMESDEAQWRVLVRGIINEFKTTAIVEREPNIPVRIKLVIKKIIPPEHATTKNICHTETSLGKSVAIGLSRSWEFFSDYLGKSTWLFLGYIDGETKTPILITYYESINITIYTQKLNEEDHKKFFPELN